MSDDDVSMEWSEGWLVRVWLVGPDVRMEIYTVWSQTLCTHVIYRVVARVENRAGWPFCKRQFFAASPNCLPRLVRGRIWLYVRSVFPLPPLSCPGAASLFVVGGADTQRSILEGAKKYAGLVL